MCVCEAQLNFFNLCFIKTKCNLSMSIERSSLKIDKNKSDKTPTQMNIIILTIIMYYYG